MIAALFLFALCALAIAFAGWRLVLATDVIADRLGLGRAFLGMILVATITSLPEAATGVGAVVFAGSPDIAVGAVVGSCVFNLMLFAVADATSRNVAFYGRLNGAHNLTAAFGIILTGVLALAILAPATARLAIGHVGLYSLALAGLYVLAARLLYAVNIQAPPSDEDLEPQTGLSLRAAIIRCAVAGIVVVIAGGLLSVSADQIATKARLSQSFVGVLLVAAATSLPEVATTLAAVRLRAFDLAAGSLLGSNLFNMAVLAIEDGVYLPGPILADTSDTMAVSAVTAMVMRR